MATPSFQSLKNENEILQQILESQTGHIIILNKIIKEIHQQNIQLSTAHELNTDVPQIDENLPQFNSQIEPSCQDLQNENHLFRQMIASRTNQITAANDIITKLKNLNAQLQLRQQIKQEITQQEEEKITTLHSLNEKQQQLTQHLMEQQLLQQQLIEVHKQKQIIAQEMAQILLKKESAQKEIIELMTKKHLAEQELIKKQVKYQVEQEFRQQQISSTEANLELLLQQIARLEAEQQKIEQQSCILL